MSKTVVIGLDGASWNLINPWIDSNKLPNISRIVRNGVATPLKSILPLDSAGAWSTIVTGKNPGKHGIFEFMVKVPKSYEMVPTNASFRKSLDIWEILSANGKRVGIFNVPFTYPPRVVNGFMVSGLMTPTNAKDYTYPLELAKSLESKGYRIYPREAYVPGEERVFLKELLDTLDLRISTALKLFSLESWDFYMVVFTESDMIQHSFWETMDKNHPNYSEKKCREYGEAIFKVYCRLDEAVGRFIEKADEGTNFFIVSDHGAAPLYKWIFLNNILMDMGLLKLKRNILSLIKYILFKIGFSPVNIYKTLGKMGLAKMRQKTSKEEVSRMLQTFFLSLNDVDWSSTLAYSIMGDGQIFMNVKGREPKGIIDSGEEYLSVRNRVIDMLRKYRDPENGNYLFELIQSKEEVYYGRLSEFLPDIVLLPSNGYGIFPEGTFGLPKILSPPYGISGTHALNGIFVACGPAFKHGFKFSSANLVDVAPTILYSMGMDVPSDMDGKVLTEAFRPEVLSSRPIRKGAVAEEKVMPERIFSREEEEELKERLRKLGYL